MLISSPTISNRNFPKRFQTEGEDIDVSGGAVLQVTFRNIIEFDFHGQSLRSNAGIFTVERISMDTFIKQILLLC